MYEKPKNVPLEKNLEKRGKDLMDIPTTIPQTMERQYNI